MQKMKKTVCTFILQIVVFSACFFSFFSYLVIPIQASTLQNQQNLKTCINTEITKQGISASEMMYLSCSNISSLDGLELIPNILHLEINNTSIQALPETLLNLKKLKVLAIHNSQITTIPSVIFKLTQLEHLAITNSLIENISSDISMLRNLTTINFSGNSLTNLPNNLFNLPQIENIFLQTNSLIALPTIPKNKTLHTLDVSHNQLITLPDLQTITIYVANFESNLLTNETVILKNETITIQNKLTLTPIHHGTTFTVRNNWQTLPTDLAATVIFSNGNTPGTTGTFSLTNVRDLQNNSVPISSYLQNNYNVLQQGQVKARVLLTLSAGSSIESDTDVFINFIAPTTVPIIPPTSPSIPPQQETPTIPSIPLLSNQNVLITYTEPLLAENSVTPNLPVILVPEKVTDNSWFGQLTTVTTSDANWSIYQIIQFILLSLLYGIIAILPILAAYLIIQLLKNVSESGDAIFYTERKNSDEKNS